MAKRDKGKMVEAQAKMIEKEMKSQLPHMRECDPNLIWQNLEAIHRAQGLATRLVHQRKFLTAAKLLSELMSTWI
ncbi:hypothetical protein B0H10DRAFT_1802724, partial [Mycena sp. CBHHK59/15]